MSSAQIALFASAIIVVLGAGVWIARRVLGPWRAARRRRFAMLRPAYNGIVFQV